MSNNTNNNSQQKHSIPEEDEIDLIALAKTIWGGRKTILKITLIFMGIGLFIAIFSEKEYTASTTLVPQTTTGNNIGGNLGGLAAMAGINLGSIGSDSGISPTLYPQIVNSISFRKELLQTPLTFNGQEKQISYTYYYMELYSPSVLYYLKKYTVGLPGVIIKALKGEQTNTQRKGGKNQFLSISDQEKELMERLSKQILIDVNGKDGYVRISAKMPEAMASAQLTQKAQELLQAYIIKFKIQKSSEKLKFIKERYQEKAEAFRIAQQQLASFRDHNQNVITALAQTNLEQLQSEYDLVYGVYAELAKQLETQQIQVEEDTPVFTILNPVTIPAEKSKPNGSVIILIWFFLGIIGGVGLLFFRKVFINVKESI